MLKAVCSFSKKIPVPDSEYSSQGYSLSLETEIPETYPRAIQVRLHDTFELVKSKEPLERFDEKQGVGGIARDLFIENGVCLRASGDAIICAPPFTLSYSEADTIIEVTHPSL